MDFYTMNTPRDREINITELEKPAVNLFFIPIPTSLSELPPYWPFVVQSLSCVRLFATPWAAARQASLSFTSWSLLKLMSIESVMPSNHLILCSLLLLLPSIFHSIRVFSMSQFLALGGQSIGISASASVLPMNIQDWFPFGWTGWISLQSKGLSRVFSNTTVQKHQFLGAQHFLYFNSHINTWLKKKNHSFD